MKTINLIGGGRVGQTLGRLLAQDGQVIVLDLLTRTQASAELALAFIGSGRAARHMSNMRPADLWMLAVPDAQIAPVAAALAACDNLPPATVFHASGALSADLLKPLQDKGWRVASAHCLLSFASPALALQQFAGTPCALEGEAQALAELRPLFTRLGAQCFDVRTQDKMLYHAGAIFATNFLPVLQDLAEQLWQHSGMPQPMVQHLRASLLQNAVDNITRLGPQAALTGPAARGDTALVAAQGLAVQQWNASAGQAYQALSALARQLAQRKPLVS
ncbi:Rossmann-like and DUF2520 domain-containing protein [Rhodoferax sp.]|uniref:Rossmann-like and DUF2520 domain-containing protein n=1 Tax=Rhodoferax sp. TaxID=50421 RepID=UPI002736433A|nr:Rossmann-like and DUF2520 domain-containing protein [Rhodoferax sp.]MDP3191833.1 DUF2520 domain-containing protein [Rhodoferax sp.]MDP3336869.1 DUF2520 domain-containing protein [Rhodoferax sp.]